MKLARYQIDPEKGAPSKAIQAFLTSYRRLGQRVWRLATPWKGGAADAPSAEELLKRAKEEAEVKVWSLRLQDEKNSLFSLVRNTETEFLATGEGLIRMMQQLTDVQKQCQSLTELTTVQAQDATIQFTFQLLKKAEDLVLASCDQYDHMFAMFAELRRQIVVLRRQQVELMGVLSPLDYVTITFSLEASRQTPEVKEVFSTLAASVGQTVTAVCDALKRQFDGLGASERIARAMIDKMSVSTARDREEVNAALESSRGHLRSLNGALKNSGSRTAVLSQRNQKVISDISRIVLAQQCQDIIRQKIEHVGEALDEMRANLDGPVPPSSVVDLDTRQFVFQAGNIQLQQVRNVFGELNQAADNLKAGVQSLLTNAEAAAEAAIKVGDTAFERKVGRDCQASIGSILGIVKQAVQNIGSIVLAFEPLQNGFNDCTSQATELANSIRHDALNAQVFAIHAPDGGTLEVLAERMCEISNRTVQQVKEFASSLRATAEIVSNLRERLIDFQNIGQTELEVLADEFVSSQKRLSDLEGVVPDLIRQITGQQDIFIQSADEILARIQFPVTVANASVRSIGFFQELVAWGREGVSESGSELAPSSKLERLKSKYTMASERVAHAAALQPALAASDAAVPESSVELFDDFSSPAPPAEIAPAAEAPPAESAEGETTPSDPATAPAPKKPVTQEDLGANVELF